ncbi:alpha/beta hydrolase family protein [Actinocorallia longicatena]|uniref:Chlorophyllase-like protein n=1 Tax=Actinocorallia longicatena TaxID=111803 RepID=A0ABP6QDK3_9ACTN
MKRSILRAGTGAALVAAALGSATAPASAGEGDVISFTTTVNGDPADVYAPAAGDKDLPVALLLQGANVGKANYKKFATAVASYGFVVVVPDHQRFVFGTPGLYAEASEASSTVAWAAQENVRTGSPLSGDIDTGSLVLLGHSFGGAAALSIVTGACAPVFCTVPTPPPAQLKGVALYGTNNLAPGTTTAPPIANGVPVQLVQGTADGVATPAAGLATYNAVQNPPKMQVSLLGANHYGITDTQTPPGAAPDPSPQTITQDVSIASTARWSAMYLRTALGDPWSKVWLYGVGPYVDKTVTVTYVK